MEDLSKIRNVKVAPAIGYTPYPSYPELPPVGLKQDYSTSKSVDKGIKTARDEIEEEQKARAIVAEERYKIYKDLLLNQSEHEIP